MALTKLTRVPEWLGTYLPTWNKAVSRKLGARLQDELYATDFGVTADGVTDDYPAIMAAIDAAIAAGYKRVVLPPGNIRSTGEINLGGTGGNGVAGIWLQGSGIDNTIIQFEAANSGSSCILARGGYGSSTGRQLTDMTIRAKSAEAAVRGIGIQLWGVCFVYIRNVNVRFFERGVRLYNGIAGDFTEFCRFDNMRIDRNTVNIDYQVSAGDPSFHGCSWHNIQCQLAEGGVGLNFNSNSATGTKRCRPYHNEFHINFFGVSSGNARAISMHNTYADTCYGNMTLESNASCYTDDDSWFHMRGPFNGLRGGHTLTFKTPSTNAFEYAPAHFIFDNVSSAPLQGSMVDGQFLSAVPDVMDPSWEGSNGKSAPGFIKLSSSTDATAQGTAWLNKSAGQIGWGFAVVADNARWKDAVVRYRLRHDGQGIRGFSDSGRFEISARHNVTGVTSAVRVATGRLSPASAGMSLGSNEEPWSGLVTAQLRIADTGIIPLSSVSLGSATAAFPSIYSQTALNVTSDATMKTAVSDIPAELLDVWFEYVQLCSWKLIAAPELVRFGILAQDIVAAFTAAGLDYTEYDVVQKSEDGIYTVKMDYVLVLEAAAVRRKLGILVNSVDTEDSGDSTAGNTESV